MMAISKHSTITFVICLALAGSFSEKTQAQTWAMEVHAGVDDNDPSFALRHQIAARLTAARLPPTQIRLDRYRSEEGIAYPVIQGWRGSIQNIRHVQGKGTIVTVRVSPKLNGVYDSLACLERYLITHQGITFLDASSPSSNTPRLLIRPQLISPNILMLLFL